MGAFLLPTLAVAVALVSSLTWRVAPSWLWAWKATIAAGEFGHWFVLLPIGLGGIAWCAGDGRLRYVVIALCVVATVSLLRPVYSASRIADTLPSRLHDAFGSSPRRENAAAFSARRLFWRDETQQREPVTEVFATQAGEQLALDFYRAQRNDGLAAPCLIVVHGGGWDGGDRTQLAEWHSHWAGQGYAVAAVSYRLAPQHPWPAQREDVLAAIAWLKENAGRLGIDATRLVMVGRSAGGQIAAAVAYSAQDPAIVGVISFYAPHDMEFAWSVSREDDALNSLKLMRQYLGGPPDAPERRALYESASAQSMVRPGLPPTLLLHGDSDTLVWVRHSERLTARLGEARVPHVFVRLPWATHGFDFNRHGPAGQITDYAIGWFLDAVTARGGV
jgi:acetyl esterase/lipase